MRNKLQQAGLIVLGLVAGIFISLNFSAIAQKEASALPVEELRQFADVFNAVKAGYVEPVEDKKLITHAISGMLTGLDPHSAYLDQDAFKDLQAEHAGRIRRPGHRSRHGRRFRQGGLADRGHPGLPRRHQAGRPHHQARRHADQGHDLGDAVKRMRGKPKTQIIRLTIAQG
jgi:carboxyl-terminal processing protease